jgi:hypothetical protein
MDTVIDKPARIRGYALHRMVEQHQQGQCEADRDLLTAGEVQHGGSFVRVEIIV